MVQMKVRLEPPQKPVPADDPYPLPSEPQILGVTQEMASSWLSYRSGHPKLRHMSKDVAGRYQQLIETGRFREATPEGLIFDTEGYGISFQHRMKALANASTAKLVEHYGRPWLEFWIFPNQSRDIGPYLDQGFRRTAAHIMVGTPHAAGVAAGAKYLAALADGDRYGLPRFNRIMVPEVVDTVAMWPELDRYVQDASVIWKATSITLGPHLAVLAQAARTDHALMIPAWLEGLRTGAHLGESDPRLLLREKFHGGFVSLGKVTKRDHVYAVITKAWNAYVTGDTSLTSIGLRLRQGEVMPIVEGYATNQTKGVAA
ncbi:hypothetical protein [Streptomyces sp. NPDC010273]|uniref:hypothetical protein n=1 Tax=Streptomyces sp. NPDC010273 TaxID=3364829 RepID=UPI0036F0DC08